MFLNVGPNFGTDRRVEVEHTGMYYVSSICTVSTGTGIMMIFDTREKGVVAGWISD